MLTYQTNKTYILLNEWKTFADIGTGNKKSAVLKNNRNLMGRLVMLAAYRELELAPTNSSPFNYVSLWRDVGDYKEGQSNWIVWAKTRYRCKNIEECEIDTFSVFSHQALPSQNIMEGLAEAFREKPLQLLKQKGFL